MEEYIPQTDLQLASLTIDGNSNLGSQLAENHPYHHYMIEAGGYVSYGNFASPNSPYWSEYQQTPVTPHTYVEYLAENGASEIQGEVANRNSGMSSSYSPAERFIDMGAQEVRYARQSHEEAPLINLSSTEHDIYFQRQTPKGGHHNAVPSQSEAGVSNSGLPTKPRRRYARGAKSSETDRRRRIRIGAAVDALQELLPQPKEGRRATVIEDINDYVKHLQLQIKELSWNRLGGESTSHPFIYLEGYGHYVLHEDLLGETLEEMMGKLLEVNPSAASQLLQSKGLFMMPMTLAEGLQ